MADTAAKPEKFQPKNCRSATASQFRGMCAQQKARYLAYEEPLKEVQGAMAAARQRVFSRLTERKGRVGEMNAAQAAENERRDTTVGQVKAAEAHKRDRFKRLRHQKIRAQEISLMIACQSTAQRAVRLERLLPMAEAALSVRDGLDKLQRKRVEELMEDSWGSLDRG